VGRTLISFAWDLWISDQLLWVKAPEGRLDHPKFQRSLQMKFPNYRGIPIANYRDSVANYRDSS
jgi:hypothetical protein